MSNERIEFKFVGFNPDKEIRNFMSLIAERLHFSSPSDSDMKLAFKKGKDAVSASCKIASLAGTFVAEAVSDNPVRAVLKLEKKIRQQLDAWKRHRFDETQEKQISHGTF